MSDVNLCDYSDYNYKESFWGNGERLYEHLIECSTLNKIYQKHCLDKTSIIDAGCGYGRLFETYSNFFSSIFSFFIILST